MTNEQEVDLSEENREIEGPIMPDPLAKGTEIEKWKYEQKMNEIEVEEDKLKAVSILSNTIKKRSKPSFFQLLKTLHRGSEKENAENTDKKRLMKLKMFLHECNF